jgi:hypothetical protein
MKTNRTSKSKKRFVVYAVELNKPLLFKALIASGFKVDCESEPYGHLVDVALATKVLQLCEIVLKSGARISHMIDVTKYDDQLMRLLIAYNAPVSVKLLTHPKVGNKSTMMLEIVRRIEYSYADPVMAHIRFHHIKFMPNRLIIAQLLDAYHIKEVTRDTPKYYLDAHETSGIFMSNTQMSMQIAHDMILNGHDPFTMFSSRWCDALIRMARRPWCKATHHALYSRIFRRHIYNIVMAQTLSESELPYELWHLIMSHTPRSVQVTNEPINELRREEFSTSPRLKQWRRDNVDTSKCHGCIYELDCI